MFCMTVAAPSPGDDAVLDQCIARIAGGDQEALAELYDRTRPAVYGFALSILKNVHDAEDVLHDAYLQVWHAAGQYRSQGKPRAWLMTIVRNLSLSRLREQSRTESLSQEDWQDRFGLCPCCDGGGPADPWCPVGGSGRPGAADRHAPALGGLKHREIAAMLALPLPTVLSKYSRALKKLQLAWKEAN